MLRTCLNKYFVYEPIWLTIFHFDLSINIKWKLISAFHTRAHTQVDCIKYNTKRLVVGLLVFGMGMLWYSYSTVINFCVQDGTLCLGIQSWWNIIVCLLSRFKSSSHLFFEDCSVVSLWEFLRIVRWRYNIIISTVHIGYI